MKRRAATTIVLVTRQDLVRADFTSGPNPDLLELVVQPRPDLPDLAALVETALLLGPKPGRQVWVLSSDFWTQTLGLPAGRSAGLSDNDIANALNFEAEGYSGQAAFDSIVAHVPQEGSATEKVWWIVQARVTDRDATEVIVRRAASRLAGITHPGGVPRPVNAEPASRSLWMRAELWADTVICLQGHVQGGAAVQVFNSAPQLGQWQVEWERRRKTAAAGTREELLVDVGVAEPPTSDSQSVTRLDDENGLRVWLTTWAAVLAAKTPAVPLVKPPRRPMSVGQRRGLAVAFGLIAAIACASHYILLDGSIKNTQDRLRAANEPGQRLSAMQKQYKEFQAKAEQSKTHKEKLDWQIVRLDSQRQRLARLFACFCEHCPEDLFVEKIENHGGEPCVFGVCWEPELADQLANKLSHVLPECGWKVETPKKTTQALVPGGGPCKFELQFRIFDSQGPEPRLTGGKGDIKARP
jgi:hypothetical protein